MSDEKKNYVVTAVDLETTDSVWDDLVSETSSVETVPDRAVEVADERPLNERNTVYYLTDEEAELLKEDPRVQDVFNLDILTPSKFAIQEGNFNKTTTQSGSVDNWGLLRHIRETNVFGTSTADPGGTYDYVLDGTGVDVVIIDSGIQADHPEFQDADGNSRVQEVNWYTVSGLSGTMPAGFYSDYDGHGTHVAGTVAGKTFGWAKNARIYSIKLQGLEGPSDPNSGLSVTAAFDVLLGWHNAKNGSRPTILVNSWGYQIFWRTATNVMSFQVSGGATYTINGGVYRGVGWTGSTKTTSRGHTGAEVATNVWQFPFRVTSVDADIAQLVSAGVIVCNAAGNFYTKDDVSSGLDYNNYINLSSLGTYYYHRGSSPHKGETDAMQIGSLSVGTTSSLERASNFSVKGPAVDVFASGENIISAMSNINLDNSNVAYFGGSSFRQQKLNGTSMANPQIAGICALLKQAHPDWSPKQVKNWVVNSSKSTLYTTNQDNDYGTFSSILGGRNALAFFPMNGQKYYEIKGT
jgi:subtilisin family serine protease